MIAKIANTLAFNGLIYLFCFSLIASKNGYLVTWLAGMGVKDVPKFFIFLPLHLAHVGEARIVMANTTAGDILHDEDDQRARWEDKVKMKEIVVIIFIMGIWFYSLYR